MGMSAYWLQLLFVQKGDVQGFYASTALSICHENSALKYCLFLLALSEVIDIQQWQESQWMAWKKATYLNLWRKSSAITVC